MFRNICLLAGAATAAFALTLAAQNPAQQPAQQQPAQQQPVTPQQRVNPAQPGAGQLPNAAAPGVNNPNDLTERLRTQTSVNVGPQMTLTGRVIDFQSFFFGSAFGDAGAPALQGQPIAPGTNLQNAPGDANNPNLPGSFERQTPTNAPGAAPAPGRFAPGNQQNVGGAVPQQNVGQPNPGQQNFGQQNAPGANAAPGTAAPGVNPNLNQNVAPGVNQPLPQRGMLPSVAGFGQGNLMVFQTSTATFLAMQDPGTVSAAGAAVLQPTGNNLVRVRGRLIERSGLRLMLVSAVEPTGRALNLPDENENEMDADQGRRGRSQDTSRDRRRNRAR